MKWVWIGLGLGVGFVLGTKAGHQQFDKMSRWSKSAAQDLGIASATEHVAGSAKSVGQDLRDVAVAKSQTVLGDAAESITDRLESVGDSVRSRNEER